MSKKFFACLLTIISIFLIFNLIKTLTKQPENFVYQNEMWELLSNSSKEEELEFIEAEEVLKKLIKKNKIMLEEYKSILKKNERDKILLFELVNIWNSALNFGGYRSGIGMSIYLLHFPPEDYYMFQQMIISFNPGEEMLEHNIFFTKNFENISMERYSLFIKGVFGVDISSEKLKNAMEMCIDKIGEVTQGFQFDYELYSNDDILIKMIVMEDVNGSKYIAICSKYIPK